MMRILVNHPVLLTAARHSLLLLQSNSTKAVPLSIKSKLLCEDWRKARRFSSLHSVPGGNSPSEIRAWFVTETDPNEDQRAPRLPNPPTYLSIEEVTKRSGVIHHKFGSETCETNPEFVKLKKKLGLTFEDTLEISKETLPNYDEMIKRFYTEHIHSDDEIRLCLAGSGYFDVRDIDDKWVRLEIAKDDLLIIPAGIYHRFTLDFKDFVILKRMFAGVPVWTAIHRPADNHPVRKAYLKQMSNARG